MKSIINSLFPKSGFLLNTLISAALLTTFSQTVLADGIGFENGVTGWSQISNQGTWYTTPTIGQFRSGATGLVGSAKNTGSVALAPASFSVTIPNNSVQYYVTVIAWVKGGSTSSESGLGLYQLSNDDVFYGSIAVRSTSWTRITYTMPATPGETYRTLLVARKSTTGSAVNAYFDDLVMYYHTNSTADLTAPTKPVTMQATASSTTIPITYTPGVDAETQVEGGLLLRAPGIVNTSPTLMSQTYYSANPLTGVAAIAGLNGVVWEVVDNNLLSSSFPNNPVFSGGYTYLAYSRDLGMNYSPSARMFAVNNTILPYQVSANTSVDGLYIPANTTLEVAYGVSLTLNSLSNISVAGTLLNRYDIIQQSGSTLIFKNGSVYNHASSTSSKKIPVSVWQTNSTCRVTGITSNVPLNLDQDYHHFTWNCPSQLATVAPTLRGVVIRGDFTLNSSGQGALYIADFGIALQQNYIQTGGILNFSGNQSVLKFGGSVPQTLQKSGGSFAGTSNLTLANSYGTTLVGNVYLNGNLRLQDGEFNIASGNLTLENGSIIYRAMGSISGAPGLLGAVSLVYLSDVTTGPELPSSTTALRDLTINTPGIVSLEKTAYVNNNLNLIQGKLALREHNLTVAETGDIIGANSSRYVIADGAGSMVMQNLGSSGTGSTVMFPIGTYASYAPASIRNIGTADNFSIRLLNEVYMGYQPDGTPIGTGIVRNIVNKTWLIEEGITGGSNVSLTLYWESKDESESFDRQQSFISHYKNSKWNATAIGTSAATLVSGAIDLHSMFTSGITDFSPFGVGDDDSPLPVELISFNAAQEGNAALLSWAAAAESSNERFDIERSVNGREWKVIGTVSGAGTSLVTSTYEYRDSDFANLASKVVYYRLKQVDFDGSTHFSPVTHLTKSDQQLPRSNVHLNNFTGTVSLHLSSPATEGSVILSNALGQTLLIKQLQPGEQEITFNQAINSSGMYFVTIVSATQKETLRIIGQ